MNVEYEVGLIVYLFDKQSLKITPSKIVEEITRKTIEDTSTQYIIQLPNKKNIKLPQGDNNYSIFTDTQALRLFMIENATRQIDRLITVATDTCSVFSDDTTTAHKQKEGLVSDLFPELKNSQNNVQNTEKGDIIPNVNKNKEE